MNAPKGPAAPASGTAEDIPSFEELAADPQIAPLLDFTPVPRKVKRPDGWTPDLQRELIARIAATGTLQGAVWQMSKHATGAEGLYKTACADSFRAAWDAALAIGRRRNGLDAGPPFAREVPGIVRRRPRGRDSQGVPPLPGQVMNEHGEWEDEESMRLRGETAAESIRMKLVRCRRLYLMSISDCAGKRAAFEILTELPVDWEKAQRLKPQPFEPWTTINQRKPDMVLTAESGWSFGQIGYGPDKMAELQRDIDGYRAEHGLPPVEWGEPGGISPPLDGEGRG